MTAKTVIEITSPAKVARTIVETAETTRVFRFAGGATDSNSVGSTMIDGWLRHSS